MTWRDTSTSQGVKWLPEAQEAGEEEEVSCPTSSEPSTAVTHRGLLSSRTVTRYISVVLNQFVATAVGNQSLQEAAVM